MTRADPPPPSPGTPADPAAVLAIREARSDADYHRAFPIVRQLLPDLDMQTYATRVFVARATGYRLFVGEVGEAIVGVVGIVPSYNLHDGFALYIEHVIVDSQHRGHGYGSALIAFAETRAKEEGCRIVELDSDFEFAEAHRLYEDLGYQRYGYCYMRTLATKGG